METDDLPSSQIVPKLLVREATDQTLQDSPRNPSDQHDQSVTLIKKRGRRRPQLYQQQRQLKNNLLAGVGYLELSNAGDFAANVWNQTPVPTYAVVFMAIGGAVALLISLFALRDFCLSWRNLRLLREERERLHQGLKAADSDTEKNAETVRLLQSRLGVNYREIGTEVVDRLVMDVLVGVGSVLVGVGTLMAIWGANRDVFRASNLLSGYVGNSLSALFGLLNAVWSVYLYIRFHRHGAATVRDPSMASFQKRVRLRFFRLKSHAVVNGLNGVVAGAASMVTATKWWGYVILVPCIVSSVFLNYFWRWRIGYDRPLWNASTTTKRTLFEDLEYVTNIHNTMIQSHGDFTLPRTVVNADSFESILEFIVSHSMFEYFCDWILRDGKLHGKFLPVISTGSLMMITPKELLRLFTSDIDDTVRQLLLAKSNHFLQVVGRRVFGYHERYLLELAGHAIWRDQVKR